MRLVSSRGIRILVGFILLLPVLGLAHELLVILAATSVAAVANGESLYPLVRQFIASPVHARILVETLGGVQPRGIAVAGLPGELLHLLASPLFVDPNTVASSAWVSALVDRNSTVLGFFATQAIVEFTMIVIGGLVLQGGLRQRSPRMFLRTAPARDLLSVMIGFLLIAQGIKAAFALTLSPNLAGLRDTGIGVGFSLLFQINSQQYDWLMSQGLPVLIPTLLTATGLGVAWLTGKIIRRVYAYRSRAFIAPRRSFAMRVTRKAKIAAALIPFLTLAAVMPRDYGVAETIFVTPAPAAANLEPSPSEPTVLATTTATPLPTVTATPAPTKPAPVAFADVATPTPSASPTVVPSPTPIKQRIVELRRNGARFSLVVNNQPTYVTGMNYNVNHTGHPDELKRQLHRRDFKIMRDAGVNAVIGWGVYDHATLDVAQEYDIGVIMPFELDAAGAFENKNYRQEVKNEFAKFVLAYKDAPALWGWNPGGDELLHRMETELHRTPDKLQSASDFLLELSALAYSLDPNHISIVKEPRDVYVPYIEDSVRRMRLQKPAVDPNRYFVFAVNMYGSPDGISAVLDTTRQSIEGRVDIALACGEFAPFGLARSERPAHYVQMWNMVRENSSLGGFAYVFGPDQPNPQAPNPYDPLRLLVSEFSLVDNAGKPVDGSLKALAAEWNSLHDGE